MRYDVSRVIGLQQASLYCRAARWSIRFWRQIDIFWRTCQLSPRSIDRSLPSVPCFSDGKENAYRLRTQISAINVRVAIGLVQRIIHSTVKAASLITKVCSFSRQSFFSKNTRGLYENNNSQQVI